jgi:hypothetical protein
MTSDPEAPVQLRRRLIRGIATALASVGLATAVAAIAAAPADAADIRSPTTHTWAETRIGANHNQVLI